MIQIQQFTRVLRSGALLGVGVGAGIAHAGLIFGVTENSQLVSFDSASPLVVSAPISLTGLQNGETILGIDFRPVNNALYALGSSSRLYTINTTTGAATQVGAGPLTTLLDGEFFGFDFNPTVDRIRVTSDTGQNLRLNPNDGSVSAVDGGLAYAAGDENAGMNPFIVASAYTNNFAGAMTTTLYGIDSELDILVTQIPPNDGTLNTVGDLLLDASGVVGFDIASSDGTAYAAFNIDAFPNSSLYQINLTTGAVSFVSAIDADRLVAMSIAIPGAPTLIVFALASGLAAGRRRPSNG